MCSIPISSCPSWQTPEKSWKVSFKSAYIRFYMLHENNFWMQRWWNFQNPNKTDVLPLKVIWVHSPACLDLSIYPYVHTTVTVSLLNEANKTTCKKVWQDPATTEWTRLHLDILHIKLSTITNTMNYEESVTFPSLSIGLYQSCPAFSHTAFSNSTEGGEQLTELTKIIISLRAQKLITSQDLF